MIKLSQYIWTNMLVKFSWSFIHSTNILTVATFTPNLDSLFNIFMSQQGNMKNVGIDLCHQVVTRI